MKKLYINRVVIDEGQEMTESGVTGKENYIVILAEPGAGKSDLLDSLAKQLGVTKVSANKYNQFGSDQEGQPLVIDAFDELAKQDQSATYILLANAIKSKPSHLIVSSRSSEWNNSTTLVFSDFINRQPKVVRLREFNEIEQSEIYFDHTVRRDFDLFQNEVARFSLKPLLPNPQFLKLFADGYIESGGKFENRYSIFSQAILHLAKESNKTVRTSRNISSARKIELVSEVFAKVLLSGSDGISTSEQDEVVMYPLIGSLIQANDNDLTSILSTKLFKPESNPDYHIPVHKIVAEYCAAKFLIDKINDVTNDFSLEFCLTLIAPNQSVRDELRGLVGWMAALGNKQIEEDIILLDPYAVLANGDASQLNVSSKRLLLARLKVTESVDPYFRREDSRRKFSITSFFTKDIVVEIRTIISRESEGDLKDLILELLLDSDTSSELVSELRAIVFNNNEDVWTRTCQRQSKSDPLYF